MGTERNCFALTMEDNNFKPTDEQILWIIKTFRQYNLINMENILDFKEELRRINWKNSNDIESSVIEKLVEFFYKYGELSKYLTDILLSDYIIQLEHIVVLSKKTRD